ncbi:MAG: DUF1697 domain-containing protein, partial [Pseudomonadota bacterium]
MSEYISLIRGINIGGRNQIKMGELKEVCAKIGFTDIKTYIQSGNLIFTETERNKLSIATTIEKAIFKHFGIKTVVLIKSKKQFDTIIKNNPYADIDQSKLYITFLF